MLDLIDLVQKHRRVFRVYESTHLAKGTPESDRKALTNRRLAEECEAVLEDYTRDIKWTDAHLEISFWPFDWDFKFVRFERTIAVSVGPVDILIQI